MHWHCRLLWDYDAHADPDHSQLEHGVEKLQISSKLEAIRTSLSSLPI